MPFRSPFSIRKTKPRKLHSESKFNRTAEELAREFGPQYQIIDAHIGNQSMTYSTEQGHWISDRTMGVRSADSRQIGKLEKIKRDLEEDKEAFNAKIKMLLEMLAEVNAEHTLQRSA